MKPKAAGLFEELLRDARILADFSNRNDDYIRQNHPDFTPRGWWEGAAFLPVTQESAPIWKIEQQRLRDAWQTGFPPELCVQLISEAAKMTELEQRIEAVTERLLKADNASVLDVLAREVLPKPHVYPYQRAVMFLANAPWRARHCAVCSKRFVAAEPKQGLCSDLCRQEAERRRKRKWWNRSGKGWRNTKQGKSKSKSKR